jgi:hypothetical protein
MISDPKGGFLAGVGFMEAGGTVVQVGDGRGFIIATKCARYVVTAAHCVEPRRLRIRREISRRLHIKTSSVP